MDSSVKYALGLNMQTQVGDLLLKPQIFSTAAAFYAICFHSTE